MKHGIYYAYWEKEWSADYIKYVDKTAKLGFDILEIGGTPLPNYSKDEVKRLKDAADVNHIELTVGYGPSAEHNIGNSKIRTGALEWYKKLFSAMEQLDSKVLGGALYSYWPVDYSKAVDKEEDWKNAVDGMRLLAKEAANYGVELNLECLNRFENHILNTAEEGVAFVKDVGMDNVWVMLDTFHMNIEESSIGDAIRTAGSLLGHFHTGECNRMVPGKGRMPWCEIRDALKDIGYDKTVVMEPFVQMGGQVGSDIKVWRDISHGASEEQLDIDAKRAVEFQKNMLEWK
ncbi:MAG: sugar phosphate isomerase/epimerase [Lachnospiraceae bacterium]|jgi:D-psicose/D-tagatose/L-ribulose 3-epimerase|nr:sugar phosphate isomerase/epimerase [Lachnospiraceae bacterium]